MERISGILSKALFQSVSREYKSRKMERERERERKFFFRQVRVPPHLLLDPKVQIVLTSSSAQFSSINLVKPYLKREYFSIEACWGPIVAFFFALCAGSMEWCELLLFGSNFAANHHSFDFPYKIIWLTFFSRMALLKQCSWFFLFWRRKRVQDEPIFSTCLFSKKSLDLSEEVFSGNSPLLHLLLQLAFLSHHRSSELRILLFDLIPIAAQKPEDYRWLYPNRHLHAGVPT